MRLTAAGYSGYSPELDHIDVFEHMKLGDIGDIDVVPADVDETMNRITNFTSNLWESGKFLIGLGGDHGITFPIVKALAERACTLQQDWRAFRHSRAMATEDEQMFARIDELLSSTAADASTVNTSLNEILMAQGYQDLSGQVIKRVIALVKDVECSLVRLVRLASSVEAVAGLPLRREPAVIDDNRLRAEGPQVNNNSGDVISGQDDVDDLLSSLGF